MIDLENVLFALLDSAIVLPGSTSARIVCVPSAIVYEAAVPTEAVAPDAKGPAIEPDALTVPSTL
ncbi:hypothetical protein W03_10100 [Nitrosomonas sp. PY1]|nr:hypothetical protein W03_10100 [Nitrosomonas sp. PY1]